MEESQKTNKQKKYVNEERGRNLLGRLPGYAETAATTTLDKDSILTIFFFGTKIILTPRMKIMFISSQ